MRYGLISNYRRSWSKIGKRTLIDNQQEYINRYLYTAIDPINGDNFHMYGGLDVNTLMMKEFLNELKDYYQNYHLIIVWDNAPFHRNKQFKKDENLTIIPLPPYSPELNPVERFFQEIRKITTNKIFKDIKSQENLFDIALKSWMKNKEKIKNLCGYSWIIDRWNQFLNVNI